MTTVEIITIGDELLYGQTLNTNVHWVSQKLDAMGFKTIAHTTVGDAPHDIKEALSIAERRAEIILITGGLGPTKDDLTKSILASYFGTSLDMHQDALKRLQAFFKERGYTMTTTNQQQAILPKSCTMIPNHNGTAPGMWFDKDGKVFVSIPGVPYEMKALMTEQIIPKLLDTFNAEPVVHRFIKTIGIGESWLADKIADQEKQLPHHIKLAYLPTYGQVKLRLTAFGKNLVSLKQDILEQEKALTPIIQDYIYGFDDDTIDSAIAKILNKNGWTLSTAESCTGGRIGHFLTSKSGASSFYKGGIIAYNNTIKTDLLKVPATLIKTHGAVSQEVVTSMAQQISKHCDSTIGIATSGIAGPTGGTKDKPVGTIHIAVHINIPAKINKTIHKQLNLGLLRTANIERTTTSILGLLWKTLKEIHH